MPEAAGIRCKNIVIDPVMVSTSGCALMSPDAMGNAHRKAAAAGDIITPNIPEAQKLCGFEIKTRDDMVQAAALIGEHISGSVLVKAAI